MKTIITAAVFFLVLCSPARSEDQTGCTNYPKPVCKGDEQEMTETDPMGCAMPICYKSTPAKATEAAKPKAKKAAVKKPAHPAKKN